MSEKNKYDFKKSEQIIYILLRLWVEQNNSDHFDTYKFSKDKETIINQIKSGNCLVINLGDHAVNATAIYRDIDDPNLYYLKDKLLLNKEIKLLITFFLLLKKAKLYQVT